MNMLFILKGQDLTPIFRAHACARSALRARQSRWLAPATQQPESGLGCRHFDFGGSRGAYAPRRAASGWAVGF